MQEIVKVAFLGIMGVLLAAQWKAQKQEYGVIIGVACGVIIFGYVLRQAAIMVVQLDRIKAAIGNSGDYLNMLLKLVGITYVCEFSAAICTDAGYRAVGSQIEILGKVTILLTGLPIIFAVLDRIEKLI